MPLIKKEVPLSIMEISKNENKSIIWLNSLDCCVLRINNVNFKNDFDKFNYIEIDCKTGNAYGINNDLGDESEDLKEFLLLLNQELINDIYESGKIDYPLFNKLLNVIKEHKNGK